MTEEEKARMHEINLAVDWTKEQAEFLYGVAERQSAELERMRGALERAQEDICRDSCPTNPRMHRSICIASRAALQPSITGKEPKPQFRCKWCEDKGVVKQHLSRDDPRIEGPCPACSPEEAEEPMSKKPDSVDTSAGSVEADDAWRVGRKVGRTIYRGDDLIGVMDSAEDAVLVVRAVNGLRVG